MNLNDGQREVLVGLERIARMRIELDEQEARIVKIGVERGAPVTRMTKAIGKSFVAFRRQHGLATKGWG
jgi:hypothetical protein